MHEASLDQMDIVASRINDTRFIHEYIQFPYHRVHDACNFGGPNGYRRLEDKSTYRRLKDNLGEPFLSTLLRVLRRRHRCYCNIVALKDISLTHKQNLQKMCICNQE